jgi:hypothetical protein
MTVKLLPQSDDGYINLGTPQMQLDSFTPQE